MLLTALDNTGLISLPRWIRERRFTKLYKFHHADDKQKNLNDDIHDAIVMVESYTEHELSALCAARGYDSRDYGYLIHVLEELELYDR